MKLSKIISEIKALHDNNIPYKRNEEGEYILVNKQYISIIVE